MLWPGGSSILVGWAGPGVHLDEGGAAPVRVLCSCLPGFGHFNPLVPLARAAAGAGHQVAFATAAEFCPRVADAGFAALPAGLGMGEQVRRAAQAYPTLAAMAAGRARFESFVPAMLAGVAAPARAADLVPLARRWKPDVVVHDEAELAGPIAAAVAGVAWASHSVVLRRPETMARRAGQMIAPLAARYGVDVGPQAGLYRYLHFDACPPSLQDRSAPPIAAAHLVRKTDNGDTAPGGRRCMSHWGCCSTVVRCSRRSWKAWRARRST
ncbi:MAG: hypothetical protein M3083_13845 [Actinomycetota bacterium]|nr:hypothetical protein [Actinomycetota bacterium]